MTWTDWVNSSYNSDGWIIQLSLDNGVDYTLLPYKNAPNGFIIDPDYIITANGNYKTYFTGMV